MSRTDSPGASLQGPSVQVFAGISRRLRAVADGRSMDEDLDELIYDWNVDGERPGRPSSRKVEFDDETLRDGLQSPSVTDPSIAEKIRILHFMHAAGVDNADIRLPGAGPHVVRTVERLAREIADNNLPVYPIA